VNFCTQKKNQKTKNVCGIFFNNVAQHPAVGIYTKTVEIFERILRQRTCGMSSPKRPLFQDKIKNLKKKKKKEKEERT
jgi:hypothetical protein